MFRYHDSRVVGWSYDDDVDVDDVCPHITRGSSFNADDGNGG